MFCGCNNEMAQFRSRANKERRRRGSRHRRCVPECDTHFIGEAGMKIVYISGVIQFRVLNYVSGKHSVQNAVRRIGYRYMSFVRLYTLNVLMQTNTHTQEQKAHIQTRTLTNGPYGDTLNRISSDARFAHDCPYFGACASRHNIHQMMKPMAEVAAEKKKNIGTNII